MSLQLAAQHLSNQGRGPDDTLVHMSTKELRSLNDLARAHGGQLTVNPHTGLPEAGLLDSLLPTIIGAGLTYFSGGTITPAMAGLGIGGFQALRTGSLEKGLMAGLGAYGGAGLTAGVMDAGAAAIGRDAASTAVQQAPTFAGDAAGEAARAQYYNTAVADKMAGASNFDKLSAGFSNPGMAMDAMGGGWQTAKYAAGAAAPYLADKYKPTTDMPNSAPKPTEYRQYKVKRRPDMSYEYQALPVSTTYTPNFAEGGGISEAVSPYVDPNFKFKNISGPPKITTTTSMPELKLAEGGRITPEEFYQMYMQQQPQSNTRVQDLKYGTRGYPDTTPAPVENPYQRPEATPADIVGVDGITYTWDAATGKYVEKPGTVTPTKVVTPTDTIGGQTTGGYQNPAEQARINQYFDNMTPAQLADHQDNVAKFFDMVMPLTLLRKMLQKDKNQPEAEVVNMDTMSPDAVSESLGITQADPAFMSFTDNPAQQQVVDAFTQAEQTQQNNPMTQESFMHDSVADTGSESPFGIPSVVVGELSPVSAPSGGMGTVSSGGVSASSGSPMGGIASSGTSGQAAAAVGAANAAAAANGGAGVGTGGVSTSSGSPMGGISFGGGSAASGGGGGGGGGGCCFIMLEARYGDGTMDRVVRRYRDEKVTERNKRGYYKLAEVFIPLMRKSKLFSFFVVKTFADPAVCYAKWYYGENKWGWIFKPLEKFWMGLFDTLGTDTKFIRENGEVV
jgi:hypothetical protein